jgi:hypothetical protein
MNANIAALSLNPQNMITPLINGGTFGFSLGAGSTQVLAANPQIQKVTFHNPGANPVFVCQANDANGNPLTPGPNPGNWEIFPGATWSFTGNGTGGAWLASAPAGGSNPFKVAASQTL